MAEAPMKHFGWGREGEAMTDEEERFVLDRYRHRFGVAEFDEKPPPPLAGLSLPTPRVAPPAVLAPLCTSDPKERARHSYGKSYPDSVRGLAGDYATAPDVVAYPRHAAEVAALLDWAGSIGASLIPFGGGSSVVGGVEHRLDRASRAARIEAGAFGPALEAQLRPHGLTLRHFPQSFEYSTLGGWIATRSGGHFRSEEHTSEL